MLAQSNRKKVMLMAALVAGCFYCVATGIGHAIDAVDGKGN